MAVTFNIYILSKRPIYHGLPREYDNKVKKKKKKNLNPIAWIITSQYSRIMKMKGGFFWCVVNL